MTAVAEWANRKASRGYPVLYGSAAHFTPGGA